jgi:hypothetical protein
MTVALLKEFNFASSTARPSTILIHRQPHITSRFTFLEIFRAIRETAKYVQSKVGFPHLTCFSACRLRRTFHVFFIASSLHICTARQLNKDRYYIAQYLVSISLLFKGRHTFLFVIMDDIELPPINNSKEGEVGSPRSQSGNDDANGEDVNHVAPKEMHFKEMVELAAESLPVTIVMSLFTVWALFSDDIRLAATMQDADEGFMIVISIAFFLFFAELIAASYYKEGYLILPSFTPVPGESFCDKVKRVTNLGSFYFWLDIIATLSLIFEVI